MVDRSISRPHRWKVKGRLAVLEYAAQHGSSRRRLGSISTAKPFGPGASVRARPAQPDLSRAIPREAGAASPIGL